MRQTLTVIVFAATALAVAACGRRDDPGVAMETPGDSATGESGLEESDSGASSTASDTDTSRTTATTWATTSTTKPWNIDTDAVMTTTTAADEPDPGTGEPQGESGHESNESDGDESFALLYGEGDFVAGMSYTPFIEFIAVESGEEVCVIVLDVTAEPTDACVECDVAFGLTITGATVEIEDGCANYGVDASTWTGAILGVGVVEETLYTDEGSGFAVVEDGWGEAIDGYFVWEVPFLGT